MGEQIHFWFNIAEAGLWFVIGIGFAFRARALPASVRPIAVSAAVAFVFFGVSDLIETQTGAWFRPWPLFVLKALCVATFVGCLVRYRVVQRRDRRTSGHS